MDFLSRPSGNFNPNFPRKRTFNELRSGIKAWRLIVRGLDDYTKREELEEYFGRCGKLKEIVIPKSKLKKDANAPFGFIQYQNKSDAERAIQLLNNEPFKGRKLKVEISMDKNTYITNQQEGKETAAKKLRMEVKAELSDNENKSEQDDVKSIQEIKIKNPPKKLIKKKPARNGSAPEFEDLVESSESEDEAVIEDESETNSESEEDEDESANEESDVEEYAEDEKPIAKSSKTNLDKPKKNDQAVEEGRVIFLRNLSFGVTNESLKEAMEKFGEVTLAILCTFKDSGHPTGTAFVHFKEKEEADKVLDALEAGDGILIDGRKAFGYRAVAKEKAGEFKKPEKSQSDNRNLYLLRVSLIRPESAQANDMSEEDAAKRAALLSATKQKLKNLHMFVSPTRLSIHNVPFTVDDKELMKICKEATKNPKAYVTECRTMRKKLSNNSGGKLKLGASKGYAFVEFRNHEDALACLKKLNNNPDIFKKDRRPIVEFSIENRAALRIREQRVIKNQQEPQKKDDSRNQAAVEKTKKALMKTSKNPLPKKFFAAKNKNKKATNGKKKASKKTIKKKAGQKKR